MKKILDYLKDFKLWEFWYIPYNGSCRTLDHQPQVRCLPDCIGANAAISACGKGGQWQLALHLFYSLPLGLIRIWDFPKIWGGGYLISLGSLK